MAVGRCSRPEVAVCVVGQLRGNSTWLHSHTRHEWDAIGENCVDLFAALGAEQASSTGNHAACPALPEPVIASALEALRPVASIVTREPLPLDAPGGRGCIPRDGEAEPAQVCYARTGTQCLDKDTWAPMGPNFNCTHCAAPTFYPMARRWASCARLVAAQNTTHHYKWFVWHRPDVMLRRLPPYTPGWSFREGKPATVVLETTKRCVTRAGSPCQPDSGFARVADHLAVVPFKHLSLWTTIDDAYMACQSKAVNAGYGCYSGDHGPRYPGWHGSECILHVAFRQHGLKPTS